MNRGYAGFYKGHYLRSSYEYAYARYLDFHSVPWSYEDTTFDVGYKVYRPDFFFYGEDGELKKIVEIKSRNKKAKEKAKRDLEIISQKHKIECELISYEELLYLYNSLPFSLNSVITEWINSELTTINKAAFGELNGHFNIKHTENAKKKIGQHSKSRWAIDSPTRQKMLEGLRKSGIKKGYIKTPREIRVCKQCAHQFETLITSTQKYCSQSFAAKVAIKKATINYVAKRQVIHQDIRDYIIQWTVDNKDIVSRTPFNKIKTTISPLLINIQTEFGVKDFRVISKAVFGEDRGRKELLMFMKKLCN